LISCGVIIYLITIDYLCDFDFIFYIHLPKAASRDRQMMAELRPPNNINPLITYGCIWTPPVLQAFHSIKLMVRLHTYIRPVNGLNGPGHNGLFARLLLIALTCSKAQQPFQVLQTPVRPVAIRCVASQSVRISPLSVSQWFLSQPVWA
jgi:hypothetical protein